MLFAFILGCLIGALVVSAPRWIKRKREEAISEGR